MPKTVTALIVHGDVGQRQCLEHAAQALGCTVLPSSDLVDLQGLLAESPLDLAVVEQSKIGTELVQQIRRHRHGAATAIVLVAGRRALADPGQALAASGADDLLPAPVTDRAARVRLAAGLRLALERRTPPTTGRDPGAADPDVEVRRPPSPRRDGPISRLLSRLAGAGPATDPPAPEEASTDAAPAADPKPRTDVTTRLELLQRLDGALGQLQHQPGTHLALFLLDLDRFKQVNFDLGHEAGDELLTATAERLSRCLRENDTLVRPGNALAKMGGDEFAVVLEGLRDRRDATRVADRVLEALQQPFHVAGRDVFLTASIGIGWATPGATGPDELYREAERAMYWAKDQGRACYVVFEKHRGGNGNKRGSVALEVELRRALEEQQLEIRLQPIVSLRTGRLAGFEALSRWRRSPTELLLPKDYIPMAEEAGLIAGIDRASLRESCRQLRAWSVRFRHARLVPIAVNLSGRHLTKPDLLMEIDRTLRINGLEGRLLKIEITESTFMDGVRHADELFRQLHGMGISLSLDDFGTGYSSMSTLRRFAVDTLKIDAGFVARMREDEDSREIVRAIVHLARNLGKEAVAEGVETNSQLEMLRDMGCPFAQGYLIARPQALEDATATLAAYLDGKRMVEGPAAPDPA